MADAPKLEWEEGNVPFSSQFNDTYFSRAGGRDETSYVFLAGNKLTERFLGTEAFVIGELGFGTGLNFFVTLDAWLKTPHEHRCPLTFISYELYPLSAQDMQQALKSWPEFQPYLDDLLTCWPPKDGWNSYDVQGVTLKLAVGDANDLLPTCAESVDAWYLDGFNPSQNKALWEHALMEAVFCKTKQGGSFATYTAAGWVRRNLQDVGFTVRRLKGFGRKREMLVGTRD
ncbi:tRNA (5-methylaminomethyl-2-thiouridine)(34)-methyltransferase MnmD [Polycladidibacter stylochi]|uniref:tRNA (5-methylaminomethyl-2-thiouridine)(34)-methyltransferase MnmD n=1 Tax=Polycladidibacter stylochi TaxID=1807766 RepID=UPI00082B43D8|nr:tRNA (5-methylaminomethyl-2-thiouridine)(34)-methyltransferase MnmD [Pseudovibrio stylochi]